MNDYRATAPGFSGGQPAKAPHPGIAEILQGLQRRLPAGEPYLPLRQLLALLGDRGFALIFLLFALPAVLPFGLPGVAVIFGVPLILFALQFIFRARAPWLPRFLADKKIPVAALSQMIDRALPYCLRWEKHLKPRWTFFLTTPGQALLGLLVLIHALILPWPIPFGNTGPAVSICLIALALLAGDGLAAAIAAAVAAAVALLMSGAIAATLQVLVALLIG